MGEYGVSRGANREMHTRARIISSDIQGSCLKCIVQLDSGWVGTCTISGVLIIGAPHLEPHREERP
jgi:hypothetical protein